MMPFVRQGVPNAEIQRIWSASALSRGGVFVVVLFVSIPVSLGMAIVHNQLRLWKYSK
jgi:hypothetical protein